MTDPHILPAATLERPHPTPPGLQALLPEPATEPAAPPLRRYRVRADRPGLNLHAGETVLCAPYEPAGLDMVMLVRCEADGHNPGALLPVEELEDLGPTGQMLGPGSWGKPGVRH